MIGYGTVRLELRFVWCNNIITIPGLGLAKMLVGTNGSSSFSLKKYSNFISRMPSRVRLGLNVRIRDKIRDDMMVYVGYGR